jgi:sugar/nucleoside kinase (ribokinase family)
MSVKLNERECRHALSETAPDAGRGTDLELVVSFAGQVNRPVFCTFGERGLILATHEAGAVRTQHIPGFPVRGPVDPVGAGDSTSAGIACARAAGASLEEAAAFGNLVASITVQQLGTTGTATPEQVRRRWRQVQAT